MGRRTPNQCLHHRVDLEVAASPLGARRRLHPRRARCRTEWGSTSPSNATPLAPSASHSSPDLIPGSRAAQHQQVWLRVSTGGSDMRVRNRVLIIAAVAVLSFWAIYPPDENIKLGLDLKGGVHLVLRVQTDDALRLETQGAVERLRNALTGAGSPSPTSRPRALQRSASRASRTMLHSNVWPQQLTPSSIGCRATARIRSE